MYKFLALLVVVNSAFSLSIRSSNNELQFKIYEENDNFNTIQVLKGGKWQYGPCRRNGSAGTAGEDYDLHNSLNKVECAALCLEDVECKAYEARRNEDHNRCEIWKTMPNGVKDFRQTWECKIKVVDVPTKVDVLNFDDRNMLDKYPFGLTFLHELDYKGFHFEKIGWYDIRGQHHTNAVYEREEEYLGFKNNLKNGPASPTVTILPKTPEESLVMSKSESFSVFSFKATVIFDTRLREREMYIAGFDSENNMVAVQSVILTFDQLHREIKLSPNFQDIFKIEFKIAQVEGYDELSFYYMLDDIVYATTGTASVPATSSVPARRDAVDYDPVLLFQTGEVSTKTETDPKEMFENN